MAGKDCKNCAHVGKNTYSNMICTYPIPECYKTAGADFVSGYEAQECTLFITVAEVQAEAQQQGANVQNCDPDAPSE